jgi:hypothetical protein
MPEASSEAPLRLSVVLVTDTWERIRPVVAGILRQPVCGRIELVLVCPPGAAPADVQTTRALGAVRTVRVAGVLPLPLARAAGVRAAAAPVVFVGETHTYPEPGWAEALLAAFDGPWSVVVPAITNANPSGAVSWAAYLFGYGRWSPERPCGELDDPLVYNTGYRREALLELGERLDGALASTGETLWRDLRARGHRAYFEPRARIAHLNVGRCSALAAETFCGGVLMGAVRAARWRWPRRIAYAAACPLIAAVLLWRCAPAVRRAGAEHRLPISTLPVLVATAVLRAAGECLGYLGAPTARAEALLTDVEIRKAVYAVAT